MRLRLRACQAAFGFALLGFVARAHADEPNLRAREHFARGYAFAEAGNPAAAIGEFEQAYAESPNPSVLYNLGQAYAAAGRSSEAIDALQRYLKLGGPSVGEARAHHVETLIAYHSQRVGSVAIEVEPASAQLVVDGKPLAAGSRSVTLDAGVHGVSVIADGFEPATARVEVQARETAKLSVRLVPRALPVELRSTCALRQVTLFVDGAPRGSTPVFVSSLELSGKHHVRFERPGYVPDEHEIELQPGVARTITCKLRIDPHDARHAELIVAHPQGTQVLLDDGPLLSPAVPWGEHQILVTGPGFAVESRQLTLKPGEHARVTLIPTRDPKELAGERARARSAFRLGAYVSAGVGVATAVTAAALYVDNGNRYLDWQSRTRKVVSTLPSDPNAPDKLDQLLAEENGLRRRDAWALGLTVFSCAALTASAVLYFAGREPQDRLIVTAGAEPSLGYEHRF